MADHLAAAVRASRIYQWLTTEPEPDVIVIDLRETRTVRPVLAVLDHLDAAVSRRWTASRSARVAKQITTQFRARPIQILSVTVLTAVLTTLLVGLARGSPGEADLGAHLLAMAAALAGTRVRHSWDELAHSRAGRFLRAALEPPEPPENGEDT